MMKTLYSLWEDDGTFICCAYFTEGEQPYNASELIPDGFIDPRLINGIIVEAFVDERTPEQKMSDKIQSEKNKYLTRISDGQNAYAEISAEFRIAKLTQQITEETHAAIEEILIPVRNEVLAGQWISGLNKLVGIGSAAIGQTLYDRLYNQIDDYIQNSYTTEEINSEKISPNKSR